MQLLTAEELAKSRRDWRNDTIALLPRHDIRLIALQGDGPRFAGHFIQAWDRIPLWARRKILGYWRRISEGYRPPFAYPYNELMDDWSGRTRKVLATVGRQGREIRFRAKELGTMPDPAAWWLIAHELAHVYQWTTDDPVMLKSRRTAGQAIEDWADELAREWGFDVDEDEFDDWCFKRPKRNPTA